MTANRDLNAEVVDNPSSDLVALSAQVGNSVKGDRAIAVHAHASPELLTRLAASSDRQTLRNVVLNPQTPPAILLKLARTFPGEFFLNPAFDLMLMENPNLLFDLPTAVMRNILMRPDCPDSFLHWAAMHGEKQHQIALVSRTEISRDLLELVANGPHVKPAEAAAGRLMTC
jgi:hypothetical protein